MNLQGKINVIKDAKDDIKTAIISKGQTPSGNITTYAEAINAIDTANNTSLTITPSTTAQIFRPTSPYSGFDNITVNKVTSSIDNSIQSNNIRQGASILGVPGNVVQLRGETKTVTPTTSTQILMPSVNKNAFTQITINGVTSSIDNNCIPSNIKSGSTILGIEGTFEGFISNINNNYLISTTGDMSLLKNNEYILSPTETLLQNNNLQSAYSSNTSVKKINLGFLETIAGSSTLKETFKGCSNLLEANLSNLTTITGTGSLNATFKNCTNLTNIDFTNLITIGGQLTLLEAFRNCTSLINIIFPSLTTINGSAAMTSAFASCTSLTMISFPALTSSGINSNLSQFNNMLSSVTGCTVHFPSNLQSVIGSWSDVTSGFGGTNTTVLFDLPATT